MILLIAVIWSAFVLWFQSGVISNLIKQGGSRNYSSANGWITHSQVTERKALQSSKKPVYGVDIHYRYEVGSKLFDGSRYRYNNSPSIGGNTEWANSVAAAHPEGAEIQVFYNRKNHAESVLDPGFNGRDVMMFMVLAPFNCMILVLWVLSLGWLRRRIFRPTAGGAKIRKDGHITRVNLPPFKPSVIALGVIGVLCFFSAFILGAEPPFSKALSVLGAIFLIGASSYCWLRTKTMSEDYELAIDRYAGAVILPIGFGRKSRYTIPFEDIVAIETEVIARRGRHAMGYSFAPAVHVKNAAPYRLVNWQERDRAESLTHWMRAHCF